MTPERYLGPTLRLAGLAAVLLPAVLLPPESHGRATGSTAPVQDAAVPAQAQVPSPTEITTRYRALADSAARAEREAAALGNVDELAAELETLQRRQAELRELLDALTTAEYIRPERIFRVRDRALVQDQRLQALLQRTFDRLDRIGTLRGEFVERRRSWAAWQEALRGDPDYELVEPELRRGLERIEVVQARIGASMPPLISLQRDIEALRSETQEIVERVATIREGRREALLVRGEPVLLSPAFNAQLAVALREEWRPLAALQPVALIGFFRDNVHRFLLHTLLVLGLGLLARRLRAVTGQERGWSGMLLHPWAAGLFAATALMNPVYSLPPPLWDVFIWALLAASGSVLATQLIASRPLRLLVYFFAAFYPLFLLAEALQVPPPFFRLGLAAAAAAGTALFALLALRSHMDDPAKRRLTWILGTAAGVWAIVLGAEVLGFYLLARWILHATVTSALVLFVVWFLIALARGGTRTLVRLEAKGRLRFLRRVGVPLAERIVLLFQAVLVVGALLILLDIWEIAPAPPETWRLITGLGVTIAGLEITVGRVLFAGVLVYFALLGSWLVRLFIDSEAAPRWGVDEAVGNSIKMLLHYVLITLGVLLALGALGVELQNFVIVAGALGVGIGFGLQNIVNNFVSGLILLFERPVRVGDTVVLEGEWGTVKKIGLRSTIVLTFDRSELIVPNADLVSEKVTNWTLTNPVARLIMPVGVAYGSEVARVLGILLDAARTHPDILDEPAPQALFVGFGDSALEFELRVWVRELRVRLEVRSAILGEVDRRLRKAGIEIPFPQRDLHLRSVDRALLGSVVGRPPADSDDASEAGRDGAAGLAHGAEHHGDGGTSSGAGQAAPSQPARESGDEPGDSSP